MMVDHDDRHDYQRHDHYKDDRCYHCHYLESKYAILDTLGYPLAVFVFDFDSGSRALLLVIVRRTLVFGNTQVTGQGQDTSC